MSESKTFRLEVNDIFDELKNENIRLNKQIVFIQTLIQLIHNFKDNLNEFYNCCKCELNIHNKTVFYDLQNQYKIVCEELASSVKNEHDKSIPIGSSIITRDRSGDRPHLIVTRKLFKNSIKRELTSQSDEDFEPNDEFVDNQSDGENISLINDNHSDIAEPLDTSLYLNNDSNCGNTLSINWFSVIANSLTKPLFLLIFVLSIDRICEEKAQHL